MAALVYLDVDDEITSAASRIRVAADDRVALVVPYGSRLATSRINFRLLAREAQGRGRDLSIVAGDAATRALAASAGLPVFGTVSEYEAADGVPPAPPIDPGGSPATMAELDAADVEPAEPAARRSRRAGGPSTDGAGGDLEATAVIPAVGAAAARPAARAGADAVPAWRRVRLPAWRLGRSAGIVAGAVLALSLLAVGVGAYLLLPSAEITITTRMERIGPIPLEIRADPGVSAPDPATATVPARRLTFDVAASDTFETTGRRVEATAATGRVTFRSKDPTGRNRIPAGSVVATPNGIRFRTTAAVDVPRATIVGLTIVPGEASVGIEAVEEGPEGNVEANAITVIPRDEDPTFTEVRNADPTSGGTREEFPQISEEEVAAAVEELSARLDAEFQAILADPASVPAGLTLFPDTRSLDEPLPTTDPPTLVGQEVAEFTLGVATTGTVIAVDEAPVEAVAQTRIREAVDEGYELAEGSIELDPGEPRIDGQTITFPVDARAAQIRILDVDALRAEIKGKRVDQARAILDPYGIVDIAVWPDWVTAIPTLDGRITLRVVAPGTDAEVDRSPPPGSPEPSVSSDPGLEGEEPPP